MKEGPNCSKLPWFTPLLSLHLLFPPKQRFIQSLDSRLQDSHDWLPCQISRPRFRNIFALCKILFGISKVHLLEQKENMSPLPSQLGQGSLASNPVALNVLPEEGFFRHNFSFAPYLEAYVTDLLDMELSMYFLRDC